MNGLLLDADEPETLEAALSFLDTFDPRTDGGVDVNGGVALALLSASSSSATSSTSPADPSSFSFSSLDDGQALDEAPGKPTTASARPPSKSDAAACEGKVKKKRFRKKTSDYNPNRARDERKDELLYLRTKVREMEDELEELRKTGQCQTAVAKTLHAHAMRAVDPVRTLPRDWMKTSWSHSTVWKELASRQYAERHKAELENIRLKMILEAQIKVAKSLERLLQKRPNMQSLYPNGDPSQGNRMYPTTVEDEDAAMFAKLTAGVDRAVHEVDAIFEANGLSKTERPYQDAAIRDNGANGMYLEVFANKIVPFDMQATADAVYEHFTHAIKRMPFRSYKQKKTEVADDTIVEIFGIELQAKRTTADFRVLQVMRRYVQEDRILIAWEAQIDPVQFSSQPANGIRLHESGYVVVKKPKTMSSEYSLIQTCYHMTPTDRLPSQEGMVGQITGFFLDSIARKIYLSYQMIENYLMDEALKQDRRNAMFGANSGDGVNLLRLSCEKVCAKDDQSDVTMSS